MKAATACGMVFLAVALGSAASRMNETAAARAERPSARIRELSPFPLPSPRAEISPAVVRAAKPHFRPVTQQQVDQARAALQTDVSNLHRSLDRQPPVRDGWKKYLRWSALEQQLTAPTPDPEPLRQIRKRFVGAHAGLEMEKFTAVRRRLEVYAQRLKDRGNRALQRDYEAQLERLAQGLEAYLDGPRRETRQEMTSALGWLERHGQADSAVRAVRRLLSRPNLFMLLSENTIATLVYASIDETEPVQDVILGTRIFGTGRTIGHVTASMVPDDKVGTVRVEMIATNSSKTVGYDDPIRIYQDNRATLRGSKRLVIERTGIRALPAISTVSVKSDLTGLKTTLGHGLADRMVRRKARQKVSAQERLANSIMEDRQQQRFSARLDRILDDQIAENNRQLNEQLLWPLVRYDVFPRLFETRSTRDQLQIWLQFSKAFQLGAPCAPPPVAAAADLAVQVHQSAFNNLAANVFAGRSMSAREIMEMAGVTFGQADGRRDPAEQRVAITLTEAEPVTLRIDNDVAALTFRGQRYVVRNRGYPPMNVTVRYRMERTDGGMRATRLGELEIIPPEIAAGVRARYSMRERAFQRLLRNRVERELEKEYVQDGLTFAGELSALGKLSIVQLVADDGWLTLACRRPRSEIAAPSGQTGL